MEPFTVWLGARLAERGWRQLDLARAAGVSQQTASRWMLGRSIPSGIHARALALAFGVTTDEVVDRIALEAAAAERRDGRDDELAALRQRVEALEDELRRTREA